MTKYIVKQYPLISFTLVSLRSFGRSGLKTKTAKENDTGTRSKDWTNSEFKEEVYLSDVNGNLN